VLGDDVESSATPLQWARFPAPWRRAARRQQQQEKDRGGGIDVPTRIGFVIEFLASMARRSDAAALDQMDGANLKREEVRGTEK